jgi:uncharacterized membrane protein
MANIGAGERDKSSRRPPPGAGSGQGFGWIPVALGAAALMARRNGRNKGAVALTLTAFAGAAAVGAMRRAQADGKAYGGGADRKHDVERAITIGKTADELRTSWRDPRTLPQIMASFASVRATGDGRMQWQIDGPLGRAYQWQTESVDRPDGSIGWRSVGDGTISNEGWLRFQPAPGDRGTVVTLHIRFDPPGGALGEGLLKLLGTTPLEIVADGALRRFKNLVETGEIPTTVRQPAARADTR